MHVARSLPAILRTSIVIAVFAATLSERAWAQADSAASYPTKPIRVIVGFAAGGGNDLLARIVGQKLADNLGQPVVVENKPGAGGRLAVEYAQGQPPDGYTLIVGATGQLVIASYPLVIAGPMNDEIKSVRDLVAWGKANPHKSNYPTSSPAFTIPTELFKLKTGMPAQPIPYKSTNEMMLSIVGGQTLFGIADPSSTVPLAQAGKLRALAVNGTTRLTELPDVPTMAEIGLAEVDIRIQWSGAFVIAGTPPVVAGKLEAELRRVLADAGVRNKVKAISYDAGGGPGGEFARRIEADIKAYSEVVRAANLKFE
jgi:tripartite-type tricarboxylate transporter receptor subunit TctC